VARQGLLSNPAGLFNIFQLNFIKPNSIDNSICPMLVYTAFALTANPASIT